MGNRVLSASDSLSLSLDEEKAWKEEKTGGFMQELKTGRARSGFKFHRREQ